MKRMALRASRKQVRDTEGADHTIRNFGRAEALVTHPPTDVIILQLFEEPKVHGPHCLGWDDRYP